jgi:hypothetical protein
VTQVTDLTANLDAIHQKLFALKAKGGGDGPESVNQALADAVNKVSWAAKGQKVYRVIFLVGDAPPHMDYSNDVKYPDTCKAAVLKDIVINSVRCGNNVATERIWKDIARKSEGRYTSIAQSGGVQVVATPYDAKLSDLSGKLVGTSVYYGDRTLRARAEKAKRRALKEVEESEKADAAALAVAADKSEFRAKTARAAAKPEAPVEMASMGMGKDVGRADLVNAFARQGRKALDEVKQEHLPEKMQKMSDEERKAFLEKKLTERKAIQQEIDELGKKRSKFIKAELEKRGSGDKSFDAVVLKMLHEQGAKKGIKYGDGD